MSAELFDRSAEYDAMLDRGLRLTGEDKHYFLAGRIRDLREQLPPGFSPSRILDFGCGIGDSCRYIAEQFRGAEVVGTDSAERALTCARERNGSARVRFTSLESLEREQPFDLCYANGVFHHIAPERRPSALRRIAQSLARGGYFALFENNPWNPGTRLVMSRIPFDRDAEPLTFVAARALLRSSGLGEIVATRFLFYFPRPLAALRFAEPWLASVPLGAQYYLLARRASGREGHSGERALK